MRKKKTNKIAFYRIKDVIKNLMLEDMFLSEIEAVATVKLLNTLKGEGVERYKLVEVIDN